MQISNAMIGICFFLIARYGSSLAYPDADISRSPIPLTTYDVAYPDVDTFSIGYGSEWLVFFPDATDALEQHLKDIRNQIKLPHDERYGPILASLQGMQHRLEDILDADDLFLHDGPEEPLPENAKLHIRDCARACLVLLKRSSLVYDLEDFGVVIRKLSELVSLMTPRVRYDDSRPLSRMIRQ